MTGETADSLKSGRPALRLFFAVLPDSTTRGYLSAAATALSLKSNARLVPRSNLHMTLAFVGTVAAATLPILREIGAAQRAAGCVVHIDAYEYWPQAEVIVSVARTAPDALEQLSRRLYRDLAIHRWAPDAKRWRPHITLARNVSQAAVLPALAPFDWRVRDFCLMSSDTSGAQSAYTVVDTWPLLYGSENA
ncbi:MAG: RNA 2',3'-cyclic phosphodiesterase [Pseudomonadota bacterium]|nr:RNA 2',3'-cyclic phosphodiesterase [Pseudomonadota bacterium]